MGQLIYTNDVRPIPGIVAWYMDQVKDQNKKGCYWSNLIISEQCKHLLQ